MSGSSEDPGFPYSSSPQQANFSVSSIIIWRKWFCFDFTA